MAIVHSDFYILLLKTRKGFYTFQEVTWWLGKIQKTTTDKHNWAVGTISRLRPTVTAINKDNITTFLINLTHPILNVFNSKVIIIWKCESLNHISSCSYKFTMKLTHFMYMQIKYYYWDMVSKISQICLLAKIKFLKPYLPHILPISPLNFTFYVL